MTSVVTTVNPSIPPVICDFGWYYGSASSPQRLNEATFKVGNSPYPPGATTLAGNVTLPTGSSIVVASTSTLESSGMITFYGSLSNHITVPYVVTDATHITVTGGTGTFASGTPVYDPRFYVDQMPLHQNIVFDCIDSNNLGLPTLTVPPGITVVLYQWNFGNGLTGFGPYASTTYTYAAPVPSAQCSLTVHDSLGRSFSCAKRLNQQALTPLFVTSLREVKVTGGGR